ncbi:MAG TPA: tripartite tricarboxylate transporter substrate binding protein [Pseudolabrys sp.]|nr:tripartite tricarboxylate transporter substrate binding protein [Pseudolabrys sp.]
MARSAMMAVVVALAAAALGTVHAAQAEDYPTRPVTLIVPYPAGGGADAIARLTAQKLSEGLGQQVVVENRPGAGSVIGTRAAAKATPDGYTIVLETTGISLPENSGYDAFKDFSPIGIISSTPIVLMAPASFAPKTIAEVVALAKQKPGKLNAGTPPAPTLNYFAAEMFKLKASVDIAIVTYKGTGPLTTDLLGEHIDMGFNTTAPALGNIQAGKLKAIAVLARARLPVLPNVPTASESGLPGFEAELYYGLMAPAGTPQPIIQRLNKELQRAIASPDLKARIVGDGGAPVGGTPKDYAENMKREEAKWAALVKKLGLVIN